MNQISSSDKTCSLHFEPHSLSLQPREQFAVNPAEAAVAEDAHDVAALRVFRDVRND